MSSTTMIAHETANGFGKWCSWWWDQYGCPSRPFVETIHTMGIVLLIHELLQYQFQLLLGSHGGSLCVSGEGWSLLLKLERKHQRIVARLDVDR
mmetsp:Transcript_26138/g.63736  ORF Transcript_26138/g.63736 Transcript_26138/m.63736 type:complete len:94 (-) Transcript_26138:18-299(-)